MTLDEITSIIKVEMKVSGADKVSLFICSSIATVTRGTELCLLVPDHGTHCWELHRATCSSSSGTTIFPNLTIKARFKLDPKYEKALAGDAAAAETLLRKRRNYEYEAWHTAETEN